MKKKIKIFLLAFLIFTTHLGTNLNHQNVHYAKADGTMGMVQKIFQGLDIPVYGCIPYLARNVNVEYSSLPWSAYRYIMFQQFPLFSLIAMFLSPASQQFCSFEREGKIVDSWPIQLTPEEISKISGIPLSDKEGINSKTDHVCVEGRFGLAQQWLKYGTCQIVYGLGAPFSTVCATKETGIDNIICISYLTGAIAINMNYGSLVNPIYEKGDDGNEKIDPVTFKKIIKRQDAYNRYFFKHCLYIPSIEYPDMSRHDNRGFLDNACLNVTKGGHSKVQGNIIGGVAQCMIQSMLNIFQAEVYTINSSGSVSLTRADMKEIDLIKRDIKTINNCLDKKSLAHQARNEQMSICLAEIKTGKAFKSSKSFQYAKDTAVILNVEDFIENPSPYINQAIAFLQKYLSNAQSELRQLETAAVAGMAGVYNPDEKMTIFEIIQGSGKILFIMTLTVATSFYAFALLNSRKGIAAMGAKDVFDSVFKWSLLYAVVFGSSVKKFIYQYAVKAITGIALMIFDLSFSVYGENKLTCKALSLTYEVPSTTTKCPTVSNPLAASDEEKFKPTEHVIEGMESKYFCPLGPYITRPNYEDIKIPYSYKTVSTSGIPHEVTVNVYCINKKNGTTAVAERKNGTNQCNVESGYSLSDYDLEDGYRVSEYRKILAPVTEIEGLFNELTPDDVVISTSFYDAFNAIRHNVSNYRDKKSIKSALNKKRNIDKIEEIRSNINQSQRDYPKITLTGSSMQQDYSYLKIFDVLQCKLRQFAPIKPNGFLDLGLLSSIATGNIFSITTFLSLIAILAWTLGLFLFTVTISLKIINNIVDIAATLIISPILSALVLLGDDFKVVKKLSSFKSIKRFSITSFNGVINMIKSKIVSVAFFTASGVIVLMITEYFFFGDPSTFDEQSMFMPGGKLIIDGNNCWNNFMKENKLGQIILKVPIGCTIYKRMYNSPIGSRLLLLKILAFIIMIILLLFMTEITKQIKEIFQSVLQSVGLEDQSKKTNYMPYMPKTNTQQALGSAFKATAEPYKLARNAYDRLKSNKEIDLEKESQQRNDKIDSDIDKALNMKTDKSKADKKTSEKRLEKDILTALQSISKDDIVDKKPTKGRKTLDYMATLLPETLRGEEGKFATISQTLSGMYDHKTGPTSSIWQTQTNKNNSLEQETLLEQRLKELSEMVSESKKESEKKREAQANGQTVSGPSQKEEIAKRIAIMRQTSKASHAATMQQQGLGAQEKKQLRKKYEQDKKQYREMMHKSMTLVNRGTDQSQLSAESVISSLDSSMKVREAEMNASLMKLKKQNKSARENED